MALGTTNIGISTVRTALGESTYSLFSLGTSDHINQWSRYKPVRAAGDGTGDPAWPTAETYGSGHTYGFDLNYGSNPDRWAYLRPEGGSPGGATDSPVRLGDFRGYEHAKGLSGATAGPPVYCDNTTADGVNIAPTTDDTNEIAWQGQWRFGKNTASDSIRITPEDLDLASYYWGVRLTTPGVGGPYYKTISNLNDNEVFTFSTLFTNPSTLNFENFPADASLGQWNWQLFISSSTRADWSTSAPTGDVIYLPTDSDLTIYSSGHFHMLSYIVFGTGSYTAVKRLPHTTTDNFPAADTSDGGVGHDTNYQGTVNTNSASTYVISRNEDTWFHFRVYNSSDIPVAVADDTTDDEYLDGTHIHVWCDENTGEYRSGTLTLSTTEGSHYDISIEQDGAPATISIQSSSGWDVTLNDYIITNGDTDVWVDFTVTDMPVSPQDVVYFFLRGGVNKGDGTIASVRNNINKQTWLTITEPAVAGAIYYFDINDGS